MNRIEEEAKSVLYSKIWKEQLLFIQHVEDLLMNDDNTMTVIEIQTSFNVFSKFIADNNKNLVQRSMKIVEAICKNSKEMKSNVIDTQLINVSQIFKSVFLCLNDSRQNIREHSVKTIHSLINIAGFTIFCQNTSENALSFSIDGKMSIVQFVKEFQFDMCEEDWKLIFNFLVQTYEDKVPALKANIQNIYKNQMFLNQIKLNMNKLSESQKSLFLLLLHKQESYQKCTENEEENINLDIISNYDAFKLNDDNANMILNTSAFSRKQRQNELKDSDGIFLLTDVSTFGPFTNRLSLDIRNVFDDETSNLLLSQESSIRASAVDHLREIFDISIKNFEFSVDIIIRWCIIQFLSWQLNVSQASLSLLTDMLDRCNINENFKLTTKEVHIIIPIILWCLTTKSGAFKYLLNQVKLFSNDKDYNGSLLMSISLGHIPVITLVFDELKQSKNLETIRDLIHELSQESTISFVRDECKMLLKKINPLSPRKSQFTMQPVKRLQIYIMQIKNNPDEIEDCREIFGYLLDMFDQKIKDIKEIRYLLYCTHAFMSEPVLTYQINIDDITSLVTSLCEFSLECPFELQDALISIGYAISIEFANVSIFDALLNFITNHIKTQNVRSFSCKMFIIATQLVALNQNSINLQQLKTFAQSAIGQFQSKCDIRAKLCRELLAETLIIKNHKINDVYLLKSIQNGSFIQFLRNNNNLNSSFTTSSESDSLQYSPIEMKCQKNENLFELLRILRRITQIETRFQSIDELLNFNEKFPNDKIVDTIVKLSPLLGKHIEEMKKQTSIHLKSSNRNTENLNISNDSTCGKSSCLSSRSSQKFVNIPNHHNIMNSKIQSSSSSMIKKVPINPMQKYNVKNKKSNNYT